MNRVFATFPQDVRERAFNLFANLERDSSEPSWRLYGRKAMCPIGACLVESGVDVPLIDTFDFCENFKSPVPDEFRKAISPHDVEQFIVWWDCGVNHRDGNRDVTLLASAMGVVW